MRGEEHEDEPQLSLDWATENTSEQKSEPLEESEARRAGKGGKNGAEKLHDCAIDGFNS